MAEDDPKQTVVDYLAARSQSLRGKPDHDGENGWALGVMSEAIERLADEGGDDLAYITVNYVKAGVFEPNEIIDRHLGRLTRAEWARVFSPRTSC